MTLSLLMTIGIFLFAGLIVCFVEGYSRLERYIKWRWNFDIGPWFLFLILFLGLWFLMYGIVKSGGFTL
ncbi:hypothetical protein [Enterococcus phage VPE25]|nr:hypothetical protein [Enterococcus phage VPE25]